MRNQRKNLSLILFIAAVILAVGLPFRINLAQATNGSSPLPLNLFVELGKKVNPAVVNISTTQLIRGYGGMGPGGPGGPGMPYDPFEQFFDQFMGGMPREQKVASLGSGFIIDSDGLIITNNHVIQNASEIQVQLTEKSKKLYRAKVVGQDQRSDIALIKITADKKLPLAVFGDSDKIEVGEWVAAFGNPFGHGHSMTKGIISAKERDIDLENQNYFPFIQTDASINPGNSGGPLVNTNGEVIGVNSAIDARAQGIGFAIPINVVKKLLPELKTKGRISRGFLGVGVANIDDKMKRQFHLKSDKGAFVVNVVRGSAADRGGIRPYDVIVEINGKEIEDARGLTNAIVETKVGETLKIKILRNGTAETLAVKIKERSDENVARQERERPMPNGMQVPHNLGMSLADLTPRLARQLQLPPEAPRAGAVVVEIQENSLAEQAGLQVGDVILDVNKRPVRSAKEAAKAFQKGANSMRIMRGPNTMIVFMETE